MSETVYPISKVVAPRIHSYFRYLSENCNQRPAAPIPGVPAIEAIIEAGFWASLRRDEGYIPKISLAWIGPSQVEHPLSFAEPIHLDPIALTFVSAAVERPGIHLGVWHNGEGFEVWGVVQALPAYCFVLEVIGPGLLAVKQSGGPFDKFANVAVLEGNQVKVVDQSAAILQAAPAALAALVRIDSASTEAGNPSIVLQIAISMRRHQRGGTLLVIPAGCESWRHSILQPMKYSVTPPFDQLRQFVHRADDPRPPKQDDEIRRSVDAIAGLTAIDGATVITNQYELLVFGAKIIRSTGSPIVERVILTESVEQAESQAVHPNQLGGTRHLAAAQFVQDQRDALALVASQDGRFTIFAWSEGEDAVHAHRIETLLL